MAADNRDWYRDWWRKKTGYTERAAFRISAGELERQKHRSAWRRNFIGAALFMVALFVAITVFKLMRA